MRNYDSNRSRREFLRLLGIGSTSLAFGCRKEPGANNKALRELKLFGTGTLDIGENWSQCENDLSTEVLFTDNKNDVGPVITQMVTGTAAEDFDIGGLQGGAEPELAEAGVILPWDMKKIPSWKNVWPLVKNISHCRWQGQQYGLPIVVNADSMIYLPDKVGTIDSYAAVFDEKLKGKTSMEDAWINSVIFTAIFLKENNLTASPIGDPGNLTEDELGEVMEFLIKKKSDGQFVKFWNGWEDGVRLVKEEAAWVMTGWEPIVYEARKSNINVEYAVPKEGYEGWSNDLVLHAGARSRDVIDLAHKFADWELTGFYGTQLTLDRGYVVPTDAAVEYSGKYLKGDQATLVASTVQHVQDKFNTQGGKVYWQNTRPVNYKKYEEWWSKLRSVR